MSLLKRIESSPARDGRGSRGVQRPASRRAAPAAGPPTPAAPTQSRLLDPGARCASRSGTSSSGSRTGSSRTSIPKLDLSNQVEVRRQIEEIFGKVIDEEGLALTRAERVRMLEQITDEIIGLGPLEPLLRDERITEIMVNGPRQVYIERSGQLELTNVVFQNDDHVMRIIDRIVAPIGRRVDESSPMVDARLPDGSRVNAIIPPLSPRRPGHHHPEVLGLALHGRRPDPVRHRHARDVRVPAGRASKARLNIVVSGGTGSGKTTMLNVLSSFIPNDERIVTIEDAAELQLHQEHVVTLESRPAQHRGQGRRSRSATWSATPCACGPTASSSASAAAARRWTCSRP